MNFLFRRLLPTLLFFCFLAPVFADDVSIEPASGIALSARGEEIKAFRLDVWQLEHSQIQEIKAHRHNPTERGMWYSSRSREEKDGRFISDAQFPLILSELAYLSAAGRDGRAAAWSGVQSVAVTGAITMSIKKFFPRRRPYPNDNKFGTFPSGHTSSTFAMAGVLGAAQPSLRIPAFLAASSVGWSRVKVRAHHWQDVVAGAALGLAVSNHFKPDKAVRGPLANLNFRF